MTSERKTKQELLKESIEECNNKAFDAAGCVPFFLLLLWGFVDVASDIWLGVNNAIGGSTSADALYSVNILFFVALAIKETLALFWFFEFIPYPTNIEDVTGESALLSVLTMIRRVLISVRIRSIHFKLSADAVDEDDINLLTIRGAKVFVDRMKKDVISAVSSDKVSSNENIDINVDTEDLNPVTDTEEVWGMNIPTLWVVLCIVTHWVSLSFSIASIVIFNPGLRDLLGLDCVKEEATYEDVLVLMAYITTLIAVYRLAVWGLSFNFPEWILEKYGEYYVTNIGW
eukprot:CAMPEP_0184012902 /NCGR_PEP_ID=MMETSP0954-20121128/4705_1 /TAXON_ID=627963 /ORGANISM="Aplanochytrium sp, Strain PBS07" /LENGTH=286 /DNA_ID=CAMNT_0026293011 /DNA_START=237 /DNA_END=1094 /DNA_ORIENTATION=-